MSADEKYMTRCIELAMSGEGTVSPNPMVGSVIVHKGRIIGEGFHQFKGGPHAEVVAIGSVKDQSLLPESILYVSLEPCVHFGATPPCTDLIIRKKISKVVIGCVDPYAEVAGKGIEKLRNSGIETVAGVLENECLELNRRFFTFHQKKRPFIILKWAQTLDGFMDTPREQGEFGQPTWITGSLALRLVHKIRAEEDAILVGTNTVRKDNPTLTTRYWAGKSPLRLVVDNNLQLSPTHHVFDNSHKTLVFNHLKQENAGNTEFIKTDKTKQLVPQILKELHARNILSVIVEGGATLLNSFIELNLWDECCIFLGERLFGDGIKAPLLHRSNPGIYKLDDDILMIFSNKSSASILNR